MVWGYSDPSTVLSLTLETKLDTRAQYSGQLDIVLLNKYSLKDWTLTARNFLALSLMHLVYNLTTFVSHQLNNWRPKGNQLVINQLTQLQILFVKLRLFTRINPIFVN